MSPAPRIERFGSLTLHDFEPPADRLCEEAFHGLGGAEKYVPPKYFYDDRGARLFERITELEEYYPTRTEMSILRDQIAGIVERIGPHCRIVEFGSGSGSKTRILLRNLRQPTSYIPVDISRGQLVAFALSIAEEFPTLEVLPVCADYTGDYTLPRGADSPRRTVAFFPGSTIGNFAPPEAESFLVRIRELCGPDGGLLLGVDLRKDPATIERAYNDREGVTAEFNLNLLRRLNQECGTNFDLAAFRHQAWFDPEHSRIEMRLVSAFQQIVHFPAPAPGEGARSIRFEKGEHITTEYSYKYTREGLRGLAQRAGWSVDGFWTDPREWFGLWLLSSGGRHGAAAGLQNPG